MGYCYLYIILHLNDEWKEDKHKLIGQSKKNLENNYTKKDVVEIHSNTHQEELDFKAKRSSEDCENTINFLDAKISDMETKTCLRK